MKIYLLDYNENMVSCWKKYFNNCNDVEVVCDDFVNFMQKNNIECVVSPANSYGLMDGGYDLAITSYFGEELSHKVQDYLLKNLCGEQPVGTSIILKINENQKLIHTPTMRIPSHIKDHMVIYNCMRTCLMLAIKNNIQSIVIPAFGGACGNVQYSIIAEMMYNAYLQVFNPPKSIDWNYAYRWSPEDVYY